MRDVLEIPRSSLRDGNHIWIADAEDQLQVRPAVILWLRQDTVLIKNVIQPGEQLIVSDLKAPLPGMKVNPQPLPGASAETAEPAIQSDLPTSGG